MSTVSLLEFKLLDEFGRKKFQIYRIQYGMVSVRLFDFGNNSDWKDFVLASSQIKPFQQKKFQRCWSNSFHFESKPIPLPASKGMTAWEKAQKRKTAILWDC